MQLQINLVMSREAYRFAALVNLNNASDPLGHNSEGDLM